MLTDEERARFRWQLSSAGFGEEGQARLRDSSVLVTRVGGVGGTLALYLAAAGIGRLVLAHAGDLRIDDLNRQVLMGHGGLGSSRVLQAADRLREIDPRLVVETVAANVTDEIAADLVARVDAVASCAPLFSERLALNRAAVDARKPLVDCAMFDMDAQLVTVLPGKTACLACLYRAPNPAWKREFPVFGAVAGTIGCLGALELIKILGKFGEPLTDRMLLADLWSLDFRKVEVRRDPECPVCGSI
jgi:molybdopterin/thiamine biosynthesis adenylyltransferase